MKSKSPVLLSIHRGFWVLGISFLLVCCTFGSISKLFYFSTNGLDLTPSIQIGLGCIQLVSGIMLLQNQRRRWGIFLCGAVFFGFALWWGMDNISGLLFSFFVLCVCFFVWKKPNDISTVPKQAEALSVSLEIEGDIIVTEGDKEDDLVTKKRDEELWIESADKEEIMNWLYEEDE